MIKCPSCQAENSDGEAACFLCGRQLKKPGLFKRLFGASGGGRKTEGAETRYDVKAATPEMRPDPEYRASPADTARQEPATAQTLQDQAREHLRQGRHREAVEACTQALELDPKYGDAYYNRGLAYVNLGLFQRASEDLDAALRLNPADRDAYLNRGMVFLKLDQPHRALEDYAQAIRLDPQNADAYLGRGAAQFDLGRFPESLQDFDEAIRLKEDLAYAYNNRAVSYIRLGRYEEARRDVERAQQLGVHPAEAIEELKNRR